MTTRLIFVRHAQAEGNLKHIFHGWSDADITEMGHIQAEKVAERLKDVDIDILYSSSLKRALKTAQHIADKKGLPIVRTDKLWEINGGDWEGISYDLIAEKWPEADYTFNNRLDLHKMPNGEDIFEFQDRLVKEVESIVRQNRGKNICIVTHGTAIRALLCHFYGEGIEKINDIAWCDNTAISIVDVDENNNYNVIEEGECSHLDAKLSTLQNQEWFIKFKEDLQKRTGGGSLNDIGGESN